MSEVVFRAHIERVGDFTSGWLEASKFESFLQILPNLVPRDWTYGQVWERTISEIMKHIRGAPDKLDRQELITKMAWCIFNQPQNGKAMLETVRDQRMKLWRERNSRNASRTRP